MAEPSDDQTDRSVRDYLCRRPDWRYRLALEYASCPRRTRPLQCSLVDLCVALIRRTAQGSRKLSRGRQLRGRQSIDFGSLLVALALYSDVAYAELKLEVEARILAGQLDAQIAQATGLSECVCEKYELVFFNIRHRLDGIDYIMCDVIGCSLFDDNPQTRAQISLYKIAYCLGRHSIDEILAVRRVLISSTADTYRQLVREQVLDNYKLLGLLTAERLQPFGAAADELLTGLLGAPLDLPRGPHASSVLPIEPANVSNESVSSVVTLRAAG